MFVLSYYSIHVYERARESVSRTINSSTATRALTRGSCPGVEQNATTSGHLSQASGCSPLHSPLLSMHALLFAARSASNTLQQAPHGVPAGFTYRQGRGGAPPQHPQTPPRRRGDPPERKQTMLQTQHTSRRGTWLAPVDPLHGAGSGGKRSVAGQVYVI